MMRECGIIVYDHTDIANTSEEFARKLKGLEKLGNLDNGKLGISDNVTYVSWAHFQSFNRWFNGETRQALKRFLLDTFKDYVIFREMLKCALESAVESPASFQQLRKIRSDSDSNLASWRDGLTTLSNTYTDADMKSFISELEDKILSGLDGVTN